MTLPLAGKHAVVTGGSRGIGLAIARALSLAGAEVTVMTRSTSPEHEFQSISTDVSQPASILEAFATLKKQGRRCDLLINNAGQEASAPFLKTDHETWRQLFAVNVDGAFLCTQQALPDMLQSGWGRIVNIASTAALTGYRYVSAYCATKHALLGMTRSLALEVAAKGVTVNCVCPGYTDTDMVDRSVANIVKKTGRSAEEARAQLAAGNPQQRLVKPEEVANAVIWLCFPGSEAITGQAIVVAGGEVM